MLSTSNYVNFIKKKMSNTNNKLSYSKSKVHYSACQNKCSEDSNCDIIEVDNLYHTKKEYHRDGYTWYENNPEVVNCNFYSSNEQSNNLDTNEIESDTNYDIYKKKYISAYDVFGSCQENNQWEPCVKNYSNMINEQAKLNSCNKWSSNKFGTKCVENLPVIHWVNSTDDCGGVNIPTENLTNYDNFDQFTVGKSLTDWGCNHFTPSMKVIKITVDVPNANTITPTPTTVPAGGIYVVEPFYKKTCQVYLDYDTNNKQESKYNVYCGNSETEQGLLLDKPTNEVKIISGKYGNNPSTQSEETIINQDYFKKRFANIIYKQNNKTIEDNNPLVYTDSNTIVEINDAFLSCPKNYQGYKISNVKCQTNNGIFKCEYTNEVNECVPSTMEVSFYLDFSSDFVTSNPNYFSETTQIRNWSEGKSWDDSMATCLSSGNNSSVNSIKQFRTNTYYSSLGNESDWYDWYLVDNQQSCVNGKCFNDDAANISEELFTSKTLYNDTNSTTQCQYAMACGNTAEPDHKGKTQFCWAYPYSDYKPVSTNGTITTSYTNNGMDKCVNSINSDFSGFNLPGFGSQVCRSLDGSHYSGKVHIGGCGTDNQSSQYSNYGTSFKFPCYKLNKYNGETPSNYNTSIKNTIIYQSSTLPIKEIEFIQYAKKHGNNNYDSFSNLGEFTFKITYSFASDKTTEYDLYYLFSLMSLWPKSNALYNQQQGVSFLLQNQDTAYELIRNYCMTNKKDCTVSNQSKFCCTGFTQTMPLFLSEAVLPTTNTTLPNKYQKNYDSVVTVIPGGGASQIYNTLPLANQTNSIPIPSYPQGKDVYLEYCSTGNNWKNNDCQKFYQEMYFNSSPNSLDPDVLNLLYSKCKQPDDSNISLCSCFLPQQFYFDFAKKKGYPSTVVTGSGNQHHCWYQPCFSNGLWTQKSSSCPSNVICNANVENDLAAGGNISKNNITINQILNCSASSNTDSNDKKTNGAPSIPTSGSNNKGESNNPNKKSKDKDKYEKINDSNTTDTKSDTNSNISQNNTSESNTTTSDTNSDPTSDSNSSKGNTKISKTSRNTDTNERNTNHNIFIYLLYALLIILLVICFFLIIKK